MNVTKNGVGALALVAIFGWYIHSHSYYASSVGFWNEALALVAIWAAGFGMIVGIQYLRKRITVTVTPLRVAGFFLVMTWMMGMVNFTLLDPAVLVEPVQMVFEGNNVGVVEEGVRLESGVMPSLVQGSILTDWSEYGDVFPTEVQGWFRTVSGIEFAKNLAVHLLFLAGSWAFFIFLFHNLGALLLRKKTFSAMGFFESVGVGMAFTMGCLFDAGFLGHMTSPVVWGIVGGLLALGMVKAPLLLRGVWQARSTVSWKTGKTVLPTLTVLGILLGLNTIDLLHPFPTGFDSLHRYHNTPNLLTQTHELISGIVPYSYELLISLGLFLFKSPLIGMGISVLGGWLALGLLFTTFKKKFNTADSLLWTTLFISLPMTQFMMHIDVKNDLPLLFFSLLALHAVMRWHEHRTKKHAAWVGLWLGLAFGIKYTSALLIMTVFAFYAYTAWGVVAMTAVGFLAVGLLGMVGYSFAFDSFSETEKVGVHAGLIVVAFLVGAFALRNKRVTRRDLAPFWMTALVMGVVFSPWMLHNGLHATSWDMKTLLYGSSDQVALERPEGTSCASASDYNELQLYSGGGDHSLLLPVKLLWESSINSGLPNNRISDISFLFLGFFAFVILSWKALKKEDATLRDVGRFTVFYGVLWLFASMGIIWYGMPIFVGLLILYGKAWKAEKWTMGVLALWLTMSLFLRVSDSLVHSSSLLYAGGVMTNELFMEQSTSGSNRVLAILNGEEAVDENVIVVGGFLTYFIERNDVRVYTDTFLDGFTCVFLNDDVTVTLQRLQDANIGYILFSQNTLVAEVDPNGPLHQQFATFEAFALNNLEEVVYSPDVVLYKVPDAQAL